MVRGSVLGVSRRGGHRVRNLARFVQRAAGSAPGAHECGLQEQVVLALLPLAVELQLCSVVDHRTDPAGAAAPDDERHADAQRDAVGEGDPAARRAGIGRTGGGLR